MRNGSAFIVTAFGLCLTAALCRDASAQSPTCRTSDQYTAHVLQVVKGYASMNVPARDSLGLTGVDTAEVVSVVDSTTCARIAQVIDSVFTKANSDAYVIVRAGNRYVAYLVSSTSSAPSELLHFLDLLFVYRRTLVF